MSELREELTHRADIWRNAAIALINQAEQALQNGYDAKAITAYETALESLEQTNLRTASDEKMRIEIKASCWGIRLTNQLRFSIQRLLELGVTALNNEQYSVAENYFMDAINHYAAIPNKTYGDKLQNNKVNEHKYLTNLLKNGNPPSETDCHTIIEMYYHYRAIHCINKAESLYSSNKDNDKALYYYHRAISNYLQLLPYHINLPSQYILDVFSRILAINKSYLLSPFEVELCIRANIHTKTSESADERNVIGQTKFAIGEYYLRQGYYMESHWHYQQAIETTPDLIHQRNCLSYLERQVAYYEKNFDILNNEDIEPLLQTYDILIKAYRNSAHLPSTSSSRQAAPAACSSSLFSTSSHTKNIALDVKLFHLCHAKGNIYYRLRNFNDATTYYRLALDRLVYTSPAIINNINRSEVQAIIDKIIISAKCFLMCDNISHASHALSIIHPFILNKVTKVSNDDIDKATLMTWLNSLKQIYESLIKHDSQKEVTQNQQNLIEILKSINAIKPSSYLTQQIEDLREEILPSSWQQFKAYFS